VQTKRNNNVDTVFNDMIAQRSDLNEPTFAIAVP